MDILENLSKNVKGAFQRYESANVDFRLALGRKGLTLEQVVPKVRFESDFGTVFVPGTRIRFNLHSYSYSGYADMAKFVEACWSDPKAVINEFLLSGLLPYPDFFGYGSYTVHLPPVWDEAEYWENGPLTLEKGIRSAKSASQEGLKFVRCAYVARSLYSGEADELFIPAGQYEVSDLAIEVDDQEDSYADSWIGHHIVYAKGTIRKAQ